jgi:hypothetical protein
MIYNKVYKSLQAFILIVFAWTNCLREGGTDAEIAVPLSIGLFEQYKIALKAKGGG